MITHTFFLFGNYFPNYTWYLLHRAFWQEFFCVLKRRKGHTHKGHREKALKVMKFRLFFRVFSRYFQGVSVPYALSGYALWGLLSVIGHFHKVLHINCLGSNFPTTRTSVTQKNCFRIICVTISGLIVKSELLPCNCGGFRLTGFREVSQQQKTRRASLSFFPSCFWFAIPLACYRLGFGPPVQNREKERKNIGFGLPEAPRKQEQNSPKNRETGPKPYFWFQFPKFSAIFPSFSGGGPREPQAYILPFFPILGRRTET